MLRRWLPCGFLVLMIVLVSAIAQAQPSGNFETWVQNEIARWEAQIKSWRAAGNICLWLTLSVGVMGLIVSALQPLKKPWVRPLVVVLGLLVGTFTLIRSEAYHAHHRAYYHAAEAAELRLGGIRRWVQPFNNEAERAEAIETVRDLIRKLENIAELLLESRQASDEHHAMLDPFATPAFAQSLPEGKRPSWIKGLPPDTLRVYFVGVALNESLDVAKREAFLNAIGAARDDIRARLPANAAEYDPGALAKYLAESAMVRDSYFDRTRTGDGYQYYTLISLSKRQMAVDAVLFGYRKQTRVPDSAVRAVQSVRPTPVDYHIKRQATYRALNQEAEKTLSREAVRLYESGRAARRRGDPSSAVPALEAAVAAEPSFFMAWYNLALAREANGDGAEAEVAYRKAVALEAQQPVRDASVYNTYGWFLFRQRRYEEAQVQLRKALEINPAHPSARSTLNEVMKRLPAVP